MGGERFVVRPVWWNATAEGHRFTPDDDAKEGRGTKGARCAGCLTCAQTLMPLPILTLAEVSDVSSVVAGVPGVFTGGEFDGGGAALGVVKAAAPLGLIEGLQKHDPAGVEALDQIEGPLDGAGGVVEVGPGVLVVGDDDGPIFGKGELDADNGVGVGVGDVVDELADGPAAFAVRGAELGMVEALDGVAEMAGQLGEDRDGGEAVVGRDGFGALESSDGVPGVKRVRRHGGTCGVFWGDKGKGSIAV